ncbi:MAG: DUF1311 domain-containing protein [Devosiaceae bacterium]|nr:DUF1311 domain-containing protein [Devosiaceae bacterium]
MGFLNQTKIILTTFFLALSIQSPLAQMGTFGPGDDKILSNCLAEVQKIANRSQTQRSDCVGLAVQVCAQEPDGETTLGTTQCYQRENSWWDAQLNADYNTLKRSLSPELFETLRQAQIAWIDYRDAKCDFAYQIFEEGTIRHILFSNCMMRTTAGRSIELKQILNDWMG